MTIRWEMRFVLILLGSLLLSNCSSSKLSKVNMPEKQQLNSTSSFQPGDAVSIFLPLDTGSFLNGTYPIDHSGNIIIPAYGQIRVTEFTSDQLKSHIQTTYQEYLRYPEMQVEPLIRISLQGGFITPGFYYARPDQSLWNLIALAGGTTTERGLKKMRWERSNSIQERDLIPALQSGKSLRDLGFQSGDQIWTPVAPKSISEIIIRDILPVATFGLSLFVGIKTINDD
ncbi:MAG: polysaccharide biosynthesis/export family protein [Fibrobacter sp.]|nr:polysaccharide biosynthesis/export family protein [Fibrobacter sp.]